VTLLLSREGWAQRRAIAANELAPLAASLRRDLDHVIAQPLFIPSGKALYSRVGGYCETDKTELVFNPFSPHAHTCPMCGRVHTGPWHDGYWRYPYQLWLAERAVHASVLSALTGDQACAAFARDVLLGYANAYLGFPSRDNVLGPARVFFSTYLDSLWLLHVCIAADTLEAHGDATIGSVVRDKIVRPAAALIAQYDEGLSNRQVWNATALIAAQRFLGAPASDPVMTNAVASLETIAEKAIGADGASFEGDNYHQFVHRGLWYAVTLLDRAGIRISERFRSRYLAGFATPFVVAFPDFTLPARKDSKFRSSLRQVRFADWCELGLAIQPDAVLEHARSAMYADDLPPGDTGRARTSGEAERNMPAVRLSPTDLGWKALLFARRESRPAVAPQRSVPSLFTLESQGLSIVRRNGGDIYIAMDYGASGGGHGHPDRLNLLFAAGNTRWLDDLGTGSYAERSLFWYRSTLAHNAPLVDGHTQQADSGTPWTIAEQGAFAMLRATADTIADEVRVSRTVVVADDHFVDEVRWESDRAHRLELPVHFGIAEGGPEVEATLDGHDAGFAFAHNATLRSFAAWQASRLTGSDGDRHATATISANTAWELISADGPGQPSSTSARFNVVRVNASSGTIRSVWTWDANAPNVRFTDDALEVARAGRTVRYNIDERAWTIAPVGSDAVTFVVPPRPAPAEDPTPEPSQPPPQAIRLRRGVPDRYRLGEQEYRRSDESWTEAGCPTAEVSLTASATDLTIAVAVHGTDGVFVPPDTENPYDNEQAGINGHGVQLYLDPSPELHELGVEAQAALLVPNATSAEVRALNIAGWSPLDLSAKTWGRTTDGFVITVAIPIALIDGSRLGILVNDAAPGRQRRRGQWLLGASGPDWAYLRGDRISGSSLIPVEIV